MAEFVTIQGEPLAVEQFHPAVHRGDVLMIHGYTGSKEDFTLLGPLLAERGYRAITWDNRGQHESPHSDRADAYTIPSLARDAHELAEVLGVHKPHLFGHSFGGLVAQRAAVMDPTRWASITIFCSGPGGMPEWTELRDSYIETEHMTMPDVWMKYRDAEAQLLPDYEFRKQRWYKSDLRSVRTHAKHLIEEPSIVADVRATGLPAHVVWGEHDDAWPIPMQAKMGEDLAAAVSIVEGVGHSPNREAPEYTARVLADFWDRV
jgi:pimeloyl-ACP methyl ester carboxylesterase